MIRCCSSSEHATGKCANCDARETSILRANDERLTIERRKLVTGERSGDGACM